MAEFNPSIDSVRTPDLTGVSRGTQGNRAFEALFSGIGNAISQGVQTADTYVQNKIEDDARYGFDSLNEEMGLTAESVPQEIIQSKAGLERLAAAQQQGKISSEYYYQRLASRVKGLRSKFPGYEKEVDNIIQKVTGTRPANAFRDILLQNIADAESAAASSQGKLETYVNSNIKYLNEDQITNPEKYGGLEGLKQSIDLERSREYDWDVKVKMANDNKTLAVPLLSERFNYVAADSMTKLGGAIGFGDASFDKGLQDIASRGGFSPQDQANALAGIDAHIAQTEASMLNMQTNSAFSHIPPNDLKGMRDAALAPLRDIRDKIAGKDYAAASILAGTLELQRDERKRDLYKMDPRFGTIELFNKEISQDAARTMANDIILESGGNRSFFDKVSTYTLAGGVASGQDTMQAVIDRIDNNPKMSQAEKNSEAAAFVDGITKVLGNADLDPSTLSTIVKQNYSLNAGADALWSKVEASQKMALFGKLFSPEITKKIAESGDPETLKIYQDAAVDRFQNVPSLKEAADNLSDQLPYAQFASVEYDEGSNRLKVSVDRSAMADLGYFQRDNQQAEVARLAKFADNLNQALGIMAPIIEASGGNETEGVMRLFKDMNPEKQSGIYYWMSTTLDHMIAPQVEAPLDLANQMRSNLGLEEITAQEVPSLPELTEFNLQEIKPSMSESNLPILDLIGRTEGTDKRDSYNETLAYGKFTGGRRDLVSMTLDDIDKMQGDMLRHPENKWNSSAIGRYQIVRTTLRGLRKKLGLTGKEKFTPELQDMLAERLLKDRGLDRWKAGKISDKQFLNNLAAEWASLPTASGAGYYPGQRVGAKPGEVLSALR